MCDRIVRQKVVYAGVWLVVRGANCIKEEKIVVVALGCQGVTVWQLQMVFTGQVRPLLKQFEQFQLANIYVMAVKSCNNNNKK